MRTVTGWLGWFKCAAFLSSNAQDFIEDIPASAPTTPDTKFLSSNAQDFIEESYHLMIRIKSEIPEQ